MTTKEVATYLGMQTQSVYKWAARRHIEPLYRERISNGKRAQYEWAKPQIVAAADRCPKGHHYQLDSWVPHLDRRVCRVCRVTSSNNQPIEKYVTYEPNGEHWRVAIHVNGDPVKRIDVDTREEAEETARWFAHVSKLVYRPPLPLE